MSIQFPVSNQPLLQLEQTNSDGRHTKHPHGWSRDIEMLHSPTDYLTEDVIQVSPLHFEIGCGHGEFIERQAKQDPGGYYIGIENVPYYAISAARRMESAGLTNVLILNQNANEVMREALPDQVYDTIYIMYPDPWPKRRHRKRRLIRQDTYELFHQVLKPGGRIEVWTDTMKWVELSLPYLEKLPGRTTSEEVTEEIGRPRTVFERKAKSKQHRIFHITHIRQ